MSSSKRNKPDVNYNVDDELDDFEVDCGFSKANVNSKRIKEDKSDVTTDEKKSRKNRKSLDDKLFEKQILKTIELSKLEYTKNSQADETKPTTSDSQASTIILDDEKSIKAEDQISKSKNKSIAHEVKKEKPKFIEAIEDNNNNNNNSNDDDDDEFSSDFKKTNKKKNLLISSESEDNIKLSTAKSSINDENIKPNEELTKKTIQVDEKTKIKTPEKKVESVKAKTPKEKNKKSSDDKKINKTKLPKNKPADEKEKEASEIAIDDNNEEKLIKKKDAIDINTRKEEKLEEKETEKKSSPLKVKDENTRIEAKKTPIKKNVKSKKMSDDEEEDFNTDDDNDEDDDFDDKKKKKSSNKKQNINNKSSLNMKKTEKTEPAAFVQPILKTKPIEAPKANLQVSANFKAQQPCNSSPLGRIEIKSPANVRVGLSRNSKVKPLHPNAKLA